MNNISDIKDLIKRFNYAYEHNESIRFSEEEYDELINHLLNSRETEKALYACEIATQYFPFSHDLFLSKAEAHLEHGNVDEAMNLLTNTYNFDKKDHLYYTILAEIHCTNEDYDKAIETYHEGIEMCDEELDELLVNLSEVYKMADDEEMARITIEDAIAINHSHLENYVWDLDDIDEIEENLPFVKSIVDKDPMNSKSWYCYGMLLYNIEKYVDAIEALEYSLALKNNKQAYEFLIKCHIDTNNYTEVKKLTSEYINNGWENDSIFFEASKLFLDNKDYNSALNFAFLTREIEPDKSIIILEKYIINIYVVQRDFKNALEYTNNCIHNYPEAHYFLVIKAFLEFQLDDTSAFCESIYNIIKIDNLSLNDDDCLFFAIVAFEGINYEATLAIFESNEYLKEKKFIFALALLNDPEYESKGLELLELELINNPELIEISKTISRNYFKNDDLDILIESLLY